MPLAGIFLGQLVFIERIGSRASRDPKEFDRMLSIGLPKFIDKERLAELAAADLDFSKPKIEVHKLLTAGIPPLREEGKVNVFIFLDPNCPHCKAAYAYAEKLANKYNGKARIWIFPALLSPGSVSRVAGLDIARSRGKYYEMWSLIFKTQLADGQSSTKVETLLEHLGILGSQVGGALSEARQRALRWGELSRVSGISRTPSFAIDGNHVASWSTSDVAIEKLVDRAISGEQPLTDPNSMNKSQRLALPDQSEANRR